MSSILEEIDSYFGCGSMSDEEYLEHYGMPRSPVDILGDLVKSHFSPVGIS